MKENQKKCDCCEEYKEDVKLVIDPYHEDIYGEKIETLLCDKCYQIACDDI